MLKEITSKDYKFHKSKIDSLSEFLKIYQGFRLSSKERDKATFLIAEDDQRGVYGGAILYSQKISSSLDLAPSDTREDSLRKMFSAFQPEGQEYWTARICLCAAWETSTPILEIEKFLGSFYQNLYQSFTQFGKKKKIEYLTFTLRGIDPHIDNILNIPTYKNWPHLLEVRPSHTSDGYFHGILSLNGSKFRVRKNKKSSLDPHPLSTFSEKSSSLSSRDSSISEGRM